MPLLDECPYALQVLFWMVVISGSGWGIGIGAEQIRRVKQRVEAQRR